MSTISPEEYILRNDNQRRATGPVLDNIFKNIMITKSDGYEILDLGCGPGFMTKHVLVPRLPKNFKRLIGVDINQQYVMYANRHYSDARVIFAQMDIERDLLPQFEGRFDLVTSFYCIDLLKDKDNAIKIMANCVKPNGSLVLIFEAHQTLDDFLCEMSRTPEWAPYVWRRGPTLCELEQSQRKLQVYLQLLGFVVYYFSLEPQLNTFNRKEQIDSLREYIFARKTMSMQKRREYFKYVVDNYVNYGMTPEQAQSRETFFTTHTLLMMHAKRGKRYD